MDASPFIITELGGDRRSIRLVGRGLPYRPLPFTTTQRVELTWLPGSPHATSTILGPTEEPTTINGEWKDKYLGASLVTGEAPPFTLDGGIVTTARDAIVIMDSFVRFGQLVEVTWLDTIRHGHISKFEKKWKTAHDVEWSITFDWVSRGDSIGPVVFLTEADLVDVANALKEQDAALDKITPPKFGLNGNFLSGIQDLQHSIEDGIFSVEDTVINFTDQVLTPVRATRGIIATLSGIEGECSNTFAFVEGQVAGEFNGDKPVSEQTFNERLEAAQYRNELKQQYKSLQRISVQYRSTLTQQISTSILGTYIAREGDDLRDVSYKFYNTYAEWRRIMVFNDLNAAELEPGQVVLVPRMNPSEASQGAPGI